MSPGKARDFARQLRGLPIGDALKLTQFSPRKAARLLGKTLKSAVANAENNAKLNVDDLWVKEAVVCDGPRMRRYWPRARGGVSHIVKKTCHVRVVLSDGIDEGGDRA
jgi:large subunit ribosomal protein L22